MRIGIDSDDALGRAVAALDAVPIAGKEGILIQKMVDGGLEVFVGMKRDEVFGPVVVVGLGGIYVEILRETVMRLAPFDQATAERLIRGSKFFAMLDGARGQPKRDVAALARIVARVSALATAEPAVLSLDLESDHRQGVRCAGQWTSSSNARAEGERAWPGRFDAC